MGQSIRPRRSVLVVAALATAAIVLTSAVPASAYETSAYSHDREPEVLRTDWMAALPGDLRLSQLSIPGTHDSGAQNHGGPLTITQSMRFADQMDAGIRALDIRVGEGHDCPLDIYHGIICQDIALADVVDTMVDFLAAHPGETIVTRVAKEHGDPSFDEVKALFDGHYYDGTDTDPTLDEMRGRIVVFVEDFDPIGPFNWTDANLVIEDHYSFTVERDLADKWWYVRPSLRGADTADAAIHITFTSATSAGAYPYFFASGHISSGTDAAQLWTGWDAHDCKKAAQCLPEYPREKHLGTTWVYYMGLNQLTMDYVDSTIRTRTGIVYSDFPGPGLIEAIIAVNPLGEGRTLPETGTPHDVVHVLQAALEDGTLSDSDERLAQRVIDDLWGSGSGRAWNGWQDLASNGATVAAVRRLEDAIDALGRMQGFDGAATLQAWLSDAAAELAASPRDARGPRNATEPPDARGAALRGGGAPLG
ncbi:phosphatidylinositol-specific phospholipase C domain-containing protein [Agromyces tropicus]